MSETSMNHAASADGDERQQSTGASESQEQQAQAESKAAPSIGTQLAAQRQARGWTIEQVASQLNLAPRQIQALEADNFDALPGMASVRGFIRAYAKLLKVDATPLVAMLAAETVPPTIEPLHSRRPLTAPFSDAKHLPPNGTRTSSSMPVLLGLAAVAVVAVAFAAYRFGWVHTPASSQATAGSAVPDSSGQAISSNATVTSTPERTETPITPTGATQGAEPAPQAASQPAANEPAAVPAQESAGNAAASGQNTLVLKIRETTWIEIRRAGEAAPGTSNVLLSRLEKPGTTETFEVTEPVAVTIGNAGGVEATLRGQPLDLKPNAKNNVARLNLK